MKGSLIFGIIFLLLAATSFAGAIFIPGAQHQAFVGILCFFASLTALIDYRKCRIQQRARR